MSFEVTSHGTFYTVCGSNGLPLITPVKDANEVAHWAHDLLQWQKPHLVHVYNWGPWIVSLGDGWWSIQPQKETEFEEIQIQSDVGPVGETVFRGGRLYSNIPWRKKDLKSVRVVFTYFWGTTCIYLDEIAGAIPQPSDFDKTEEEES